MRKFTVFIILVIISSIAQAEEKEYGLGIKAGVSIPTQDIEDGFETKVGPSLDGELFTRFYNWEAGFNLGWMMNEIEASGIEIGDFHTFYALLFTHYQWLRGKKIAPYLGLGAGANFNWFDESLAGASVDPRDFRIAIKIQAGTDFKLSEKTAINLETGWRVNLGKINSNIVGLDSFNMNAFNVATGLRFFF